MAPIKSLDLCQWSKAFQLNYLRIDTLQCDYFGHLIIDLDLPLSFNGNDCNDCGNLFMSLYHYHHYYYHYRYYDYLFHLFRWTFNYRRISLKYRFFHRMKQLTGLKNEALIKSTHNIHVHIEVNILYLCPAVIQTLTTNGADRGCTYVWNWTRKVSFFIVA